MDWDDVVDVLKLVVMHDRRTIGEADVAWWQAHARYGGWPSRDFAAAAIMKHTAERPDVYLTPGHITQMWNEVRREANREFVPPVPTRENIDDPEAQQRALIAAHQEYVADCVDNFVAPLRGAIDQVLPQLVSRR